MAKLKFQIGLGTADDLTASARGVAQKQAFLEGSFWPGPNLRNPRRELPLRIRLPVSNGGLPAQPRTYGPGHLLPVATGSFAAGQSCQH